MGSWTTQYILFVQKNLKLKKSTKVGTVVECLLPILVILILIGFMRILMPQTNDRYSEQVSDISYFMRTGQLLYSPNDNEEINTFMSQTFLHVNGLPATSSIMGFPTNASMDTYFLTQPLGSIWAGIVFTNADAVTQYYYAPGDDTTDPFAYEYALRVNPKFSPSSGFLLGDGYGSASNYVSTGLSALQAAIDAAILYNVSNGRAQTVFSPIHVDQFDYPAEENWQKYQPVMTDFQILGPIFIVVALFCSTFRYLTDSVMEKELKIREVMRIMGLREGVDKFAWFTCIMMITTVPTIIAYAILHGTGLYHFGAGSTILFLWFSELFSMISLASLVSLFVNKAKFAGVLGFAVAIAMAVIGLAVCAIDSGTGAKLGVSIFSPAAFVVAHYVVVNQEINQVGINTGNIHDVLLDNFPSLSAQLAWIYADTIIYAIVAWYIENVFPGEFGIPRHPLFFFQRDFWAEMRGIESPPRNATNSEEHGDDVEPPGPDIKDKAGVIVQNLRKLFYRGTGKPFAAVDGLNMTLYQGQITAFLGHNGAGKSTTISMLTGLIPVTSGDAYIAGYSVREQLHMVRKSLGVCPQYDVIWETLTVWDHLYMYAGLKGVPRDQIKKVVKQMILDIGLSEKRDYMTGALSGGQKRKVCLAMAFIGGSTTVFLDEPTSGMDPVTRRGVWDFLTQNKQDRVIALTTHFMDEADYLGDRIAIISHGQLRCAGSSLFLKSRMGVGYLFTCVIRKKECNPDAVTEFIEKNIPGTKLLTAFGAELAYRLPKESVELFANFFVDLDNELDRLAIDSYGISVTTLEEVFLKIGLEDKVERDESQDKKTTELTELGIDSERVGTALAHKTQGHSLFQQVRALLIKKAQVYKRDWRSLFFAVVLPAVFIILSVVILTLPTTPTFVIPPQQNTLQLKLSLYADTTVIYSGSSAVIQSSPYWMQDPGRFLSTTSGDFDNYVLDYTGYSVGGLGLDSFPTDGTVTSRSPYEVQFNDTDLHSLPVLMNLVHDSIVRNYTNGTVTITTYLWPFDHVVTSLVAQASSIDVDNILYYTIIMLAAFALIPAGFVTGIVMEKAYNVKRLLVVSGTSKLAYWISNLVWDIVIFQLMIVIAIITQAAAASDTYDSATLTASWVIFFVYSLAITMQSYCIALPFRSYTVVTGAVFAIHLLLGFVLDIVYTYVLVNALRTDNATPDFTTTDNLYHLFSVLSPQFSLIYSMGRFQGMLTAHPRSDGESWYKLDYVGFPLALMVVHFVAWTGVLFFCEYFEQITGYFKQKKRARKPPKQTKLLAPEGEDQDVSAERQRVLLPETKEELVRVIGLRKEFNLGGGRKKIAVKNLSLSIPQGQCFGLLGMNGAGKSTTLGALSGDTVPTSGEIFLNGFNLITDPGNALKYFGWCPQFDALIGNLTGREQLTLYCRIKGLKEEVIQDTVSAFIKMLDLEHLQYRLVGGYSGGNKRKVSLAVAMIGNPPIVFLDEPSTGMDPLARRFMWNVITALGGNKSVIVTTHSMEECDALTQRIGIMSQGGLVCLGSSQHLKNRFAAGYSVQMKSKTEFALQVRQEFTKAFPLAKLADSHGDMAGYELPDEGGYRLSQIFGLCQQMSKQGWLDDFSVSQTTLEQVFLKLAKEAAEGTKQVDATDDGGQSSIVRVASDGAMTP